MALRIPAIIPPAPEPAGPLAEDPSRLIEAMFERVWASAMHDLPFVNPALKVEAVGFRRVDGDWLGAGISPWFINLFLLPGGGAIWKDIPTGEHRQLEFPAGPLEFIGENNPDRGAPIQAYQYCPLITPVQHIPDQDAARAAAVAIMAAIFQPPPKVDGAPEPVPEPAETRTQQGRRAFLRGRRPGRE